MTVYSLKGKIFISADVIAHAAMKVSNYFRKTAVSLLHEGTMKFEHDILPESNFTLGPISVDNCQKFVFKKSEGLAIEISNKDGFVIGVIDYDYLKHRYYFMAKKKQKILVGDLVDIMNKLAEVK